MQKKHLIVREDPKKKRQQTVVFLKAVTQMMSVIIKI